MRIIAGKFGSRRLRSLYGMKLRPTSDRLRETLFDILGASVEGAVFVDVFAGTGANGIEALSRGARRAIFIEKVPSAVKLIRENLGSLGIGEEAEVLPFDALHGLGRLAVQGVRADFVFLDPPYADAPSYRAILESSRLDEMLGATGILIAEHSRRLVLPERVGALARKRIVQQGDSALSFYRVEKSREDASSGGEDGDEL